MACSANQEQVFSPLDQSGVGIFALGERKIEKKNALSFDQSAFSNFALRVINVATNEWSKYLIMGHIKAVITGPRYAGLDWWKGFHFSYC